MALTLLEASKHARSPEELAIIRELSGGDLLSVMPFRNIQGSGLFWKREESLPDVGFRNYNGALAESYAEVSQQSESLKLFGGDIKVDRAIVDLEGVEAKAYQVQSRVRAMRMAWESLFINGDSNQSPSEFDGLAARIAAGSSQYFANGGGALDLGKLDEVIDNVDAQGGSKYIICSKSMRRALTLALPLLLALAPLAAGQSQLKVKGSKKTFPSEVTHKHEKKQIPLRCTGVALREKVWFNVYVIASYVHKDATPKDAAALAKADVWKVLHLQLEERDIELSQARALAD